MACGTVGTEDADHSMLIMVTESLEAFELSVATGGGHAGTE